MKENVQMLARIALFCVAKPRVVTYSMATIFIEPLPSKRRGFKALSKPEIGGHGEEFGHKFVSESVSEGFLGTSDTDSDTDTDSDSDIV